MPTRVEVYADAAGEWRWRLKAGNGEVIADSAEGYTRRSDANRALEQVKVAMLRLDVEPEG